MDNESLEIVKRVETNIEFLALVDMFSRPVGLTSNGLYIGVDNEDDEDLGGIELENMQSFSRTEQKNYFNRPKTARIFDQNDNKITSMDTSEGNEVKIIGGMQNSRA